MQPMLARCEAVEQPGDWLTKFEVAELLDCSPRWVEMNAGRFVTQTAEAKRPGRPGLVYRLDSLPVEAQKRWGSRPGSKPVAIAPPAAAKNQLTRALATPAGPGLPDKDRELVDKRFQVIEPLIDPERYPSIWRHCDNRKTGVIEFLARQHGTKPRTIYHWLSQFEASGLTGLVPRARADRGQPRKLNPAAMQFLLAAMLPKRGAYGKLTVKEIYRAYQEERAWRRDHVGLVLDAFSRRKYAIYMDAENRLLETAQLPEASYETLRFWADRIPDVVKVMAREGEEAFANTQEILSHRDLESVLPMEYVVMDHRRLDLFSMSKDREGWRLIRPWLTAAIDMRTRKWLAWSVVETPSSDSIASVLKSLLIQHGVPKAVYWDNGMDFRAEWLEGRQRKQGEPARLGDMSPAFRGVLETLRIRVHHSIVRRARSKIIEPNFLTTALYDQTLPWWCGHKPSARPEVLGRLIERHEQWLKGEVEDPPFRTIEQVAGLYDEFLDSLNEREHSGEGMQKVTPTGRGWMSPNECWERLIGQVERRTVPADVLQFCFVKRRELTVRNGEIRASFGGKLWHYRLTGNPVALMAHNGQSIEFAYDPLDLGTAAVYADGVFLGLAESVELRRMGESDFVDDERNRRAARREVKRYIRTVHETVHVPTPEERALRRLPVVPVKITLDREEIPVEVPAGVLAAAAAARKEAFSFAEANVPVGLLRQADVPAGDDEFQFFQGA